MMIALLSLTLLCMALMVIRALKGPTIFDRILAINTFGTLTVVLIAVYGWIAGDTDTFDIALLYGLINFVLTIGLLKYFRYRNLSDGDQ